MTGTSWDASGSTSSVITTLPCKIGVVCVLQRGLDPNLTRRSPDHQLLPLPRGARVQSLPPPRSQGSTSARRIPVVHASPPQSQDTPSTASVHIRRLCHDPPGKIRAVDAQTCGSPAFVPGSGRGLDPPVTRVHTPADNKPCQDRDHCKGTVSIWSATSNERSTPRSPPLASSLSPSG